MTERKGQGLWNRLSMRVKARDRADNSMQIETLLYNLSDTEFDEIMDNIWKYNQKAIYSTTCKQGVNES
jgi:hypothetical protein